MAEITKSLGWHKQLSDIRDFLYSAPLGTLKALPQVLDLSNPGPGLPFDDQWNQGALGSCGPNTMGENIVWDDIKDGTPSGVPMPSRLFMYYNTRQMMGTINSDSGVDNRTMIKALKMFGYCDESLWPYNTQSFKQKPPQACYDQAKQRIKDIVYQAVPQDFQQMAGCLADLNRPFIFGCSVYNSWINNPQVDATGIVPMPRITDVLVGGHDVLIVGYNNTSQPWKGIPPQHFKFKNHWGPWGDASYGYIPIAYAVNQNLAGDFWVVTEATETVEPIPIPIPVPDPIPTPEPGGLMAIFLKLWAIVQAVKANDWKLVLTLVGELIALLNTTTPAEHAAFETQFQALAAADPEFAKAFKQVCAQQPK